MDEEAVHVTVFRNKATKLVSLLYATRTAPPPFAETNVELAMILQRVEAEVAGVAMVAPRAVALAILQPSVAQCPAFPRQLNRKSGAD